MVNSTLEKEHDADPMPNASEAFYTNLFKQQHEKGVRMTNYEVDFLQDQTQWFAPYVDEVDGSEKWLGGMYKCVDSFGASRLQDSDAILHTQRRPPQLLLPWHQRDDPVVAERDSLVP